MLRFLNRLLCSRWVRLTGIAILLAGAWMIWWKLPERPLSEVRIPNFAALAVELAPDGRSALCRFHSTFGERQGPPALILLPEGRDILPSLAEDVHEDQIVENTSFILGGKGVILHSSQHVRLISIPSGNIAWHRNGNMKNCFWSKDGRIVVERHDGNGPFIVQQTGSPVSSHELRGAKWPFSFDEEGHRLLTAHDDDSSVLVLWD